MFNRILYTFYAVLEASLVFNVYLSKGEEKVRLGHWSIDVSSMTAVALSYDPALGSIRDYASFAEVHVRGLVHTLYLVSN